MSNFYINYKDFVLETCIREKACKLGSCDIYFLVFIVMNSYKVSYE